MIYYLKLNTMMHQPVRLPVSFSAFKRLFFIASSLLFISGLLSGCATTAPGSQAYDYEYQNLHRFVRLQAVEADSPGNDHPARVSPQTLTAWFSKLKASGIIKLFGEIEAFTEDELDEIVGPISTALARAGQDQDIVFQSRGYRGMFGEHSEPTYTSGRVFVRNGQLNLILGELHSAPDIDASDVDDIRYPPGSRSARVETGWALSKGSGQLVDGRGDWVRFAMTGETDLVAPAGQAGTTAPSPTAPNNKTPERTEIDATVGSQSQKIESRLRVLDDLKAKGLISDDEYQAKRKAILDGI